MVTVAGIAPRRERPAQLRQPGGLDERIAAGSEAGAQAMGERRVAGEQDEFEGLPGLQSRCGGPGLEGQSDPEPAALLWPAIDADLSAHELGQLAHDGEPEPRA